nr:hypothetical protein Q903MT_gene4411 [Picea sitchensis]
MAPQLNTVPVLVTAYMKLMAPTIPFTPWHLLLHTACSRELLQFYKESSVGSLGRSLFFWL